MTVRLMRLRTLRLGEFRFELRSFLDVLELPFLETYRYHTRGNVFAVDNVISLLHLSGIHLKQLTLVVAFPRMEDIKKLLDAIPCLQNLYLSSFSSFISSLFCLRWCVAVGCLFRSFPKKMTTASQEGGQLAWIFIVPSFPMSDHGNLHKLKRRITSEIGWARIALLNRSEGHQWLIWVWGERSRPFTMSCTHTYFRV